MWQQWGQNRPNMLRTGLCLWRIARGDICQRKWSSLRVTLRVQRGGHMATPAWRRHVAVMGKITITGRTVCVSLGLCKRRCFKYSYELFILSVLLIECAHVMLHSGHMTSILLSILERDPPLFLSWRFLHFFLTVKGSISWEFFLIRCEVKGQECVMCTDCKALWGEFVICDIGQYKINWSELNLSVCVWQEEEKYPQNSQ